jgi:DNA-binding beta-propeller fold protein YncE
VVLAGGCGPSPTSGRRLPGPSGRLNPIYDVSIVYPDTTIIVGGLPHRGLDLDLELEFSDASLRDDDTLFAARARVVTVVAGGAPQAFELLGPLDLEGTIQDGVLATGLFGPIRVGTANLILELTGTIQDGRRRVAGDAALFGLADRGAFEAVKRRRYLVAGTDLLSIGQAAVISVRYGTRVSVEHDLEIVSADPVARMEDGRPIVVNRLSYDTLQGLDPFDGFRTTFEYSTGNGSNPHDVVILPTGSVPAPAASAGAETSPLPAAAGTAFVPRYGKPFNDLAVIDLADGTPVDRIDLVPYARNRDGLPRADQALLHDGLIYVTLQDANDSFTEFMNGRVAVIDPERRRVIEVIDLVGQNPFESLAYLEETGLIYVGLAGIFPGLLPQALTGGVEAIDPETRRPLGLVVDDDVLGGNVSAVAMMSATRGYCVVSDLSYRNFVKAFDPSIGQSLGTVYESGGLIATIESDGDGYLLIADASFSDPRVVVLDAADGRPVASIPARVPPFSIAILTRGL